jgi:hypothetical protein
VQSADSYQRPSDYSNEQMIMVRMLDSTPAVMPGRTLELFGSAKRLELQMLAAGGNRGK